MEQEVKKSMQYLLDLMDVLLNLDKNYKQS